jgi:DNA-binding CsgD family transcriptional regulator
MSDSAIIQLVGETDELCFAGDLSGAEAHFISGVQRLCHGIATWWSVFRGDEVLASTMHGLPEAELNRWQTSFLESGEYCEHPIWTRLRERQGRVKTFARADLIADAEWRRSPYSDFALSFKADDLLTSMVQLGQGMDALIAVTKAPGERFDGSERDVLDRLARVTAPLHRRFQLARAPHAVTRDALAPRLREVLDLLLQGAAEKVIAETLQKSPRTIHKYVETIYREFGVTSRAALMALWVRR